MSSCCDGRTAVDRVYAVGPRQPALPQPWAPAPRAAVDILSRDVTDWDSPSDPAG